MSAESERRAHKLSLPITSFKDEYMHESEAVSVLWNEVTSGQVDAENPRSPIIYIPGWSVDADNPAAREISSAMADTDKTTVYTVDPRIKTAQENGVRIQAEALAQWISERGITEFTLAGNSLGAVESVYLLSYLKKHAPNVKINGLLLFEALPIHNQTKGELIKGYFSDIVPGFLKTRLNPFVPQEIKKRAKAADSASMESMNRDGKPWTMIRNLVNQEVRAMQEMPEEYSDIDVPVVLVHGGEDTLSRMSDALSQQQESSDSTMNTDELMEDFSERSRVMKGLFPNAPNVRVLIGKKYGTHQLPGVRPSAVAKSALLHLRWAQERVK